MRREEKALLGGTCQSRPSHVALPVRGATHSSLLKWCLAKVLSFTKGNTHCEDQMCYCLVLSQNCWVSY